MLGNDSREQIVSLIANHIINNREKTNTKADDYALAQTILDNATDDQLWRIFYSYVHQDRPFKLVSGLKDNMIGMEYAGMFVGVETDGYAHT